MGIRAREWRMVGPALRVRGRSAGVFRALPGHLRMQRFQDVHYEIDEDRERPALLRKVTGWVVGS